MPDLTKEIHNYAMASDDNLIVFVQTARSFDKLRKNLISGFAKKLEEKLKENYPSNNGWIINERMLIENPLGTYPKLAVRKTGWPQQLSVAIEAGKSCKDVDYGVFWEKELQRTNPGIRNGIFAFMGERFHSNKKTESWPWYKDSARFDDWSKEDALTSMRQVIKGEPTAEILDFFYAELVSIVKALDEYLNPVAGSGAS